METNCNYSDVVLIDTCTFINLEKSNVTDNVLHAFKKVIELGCPICISDLSFVELILGCKKCADLSEHISNLENMRFNVFGRYDVLKDYLEPNNIKKIKSIKRLTEFKKKIKTIRNKIVFYPFLDMFISYAQLILMMLQIEDRYYWDGAFFLINSLFMDKRSEIEQVLFETMNDYSDKEKENKKLLKEIFNALLCTLLPLKNSEKYIESELKERLNKIDSKEHFLILFNSFKLKKDLLFGDLCYIKPMMERFKENITYSSKEDEIYKDCINYVVMRILSKDANCDFHDLVDLLNISMTGYNLNKIHYYSDDNKWIKFATIEKTINKNLKHHL